MTLFSERYGYNKPSDALITECMPQEVQNAIYNCLDHFRENHRDIFKTMDMLTWTDFLNKKKCDYDGMIYNYGYVCLNYIDNVHNLWYQKLSLIDFLLEILTKMEIYYHKKYPTFVDSMNRQFVRLNYGYRIINKYVTPISSKEEVESIEEAIENAKDNIKEHLNSALKHLSDKDKPDYRNSIKESISAVGALCREMTGENDLGKALYSLEKKQVFLHPQLKAAFGNLYNYVNEKQSGIRHELMDETSTYVPTYHEAKYMLVICSAFINYLNGKNN